MRQKNYGAMRAAKDNGANWPTLATKCNEAPMHGATRCPHAGMNWSTAAA